MGDAATVYELFMAELMKLPPAQRAAALAGGELADGLDDAAGSAKTFDLIAANTIDTTSDAAKGFKAAADRVSAFDNALRRMTDPAFRAQQATRPADAADKLTERISEARKGTDGYSLTLDKNTDAGRENRRAIMDRASAILEEISTMVEQGASVEEVERRYIELREELIDQASAFTDTRLEAQQYVQELGMVPSSVYTAFDIVNNDQAHAKVDEILGQMDKIPPELHSRIRPLMDQDDYRAVLIHWRVLDEDSQRRLKLVPGGGIAASANAPRQRDDRKEVGLRQLRASQLVSSITSSAGTAGTRRSSPLATRRPPSRCSTPTHGSRAATGLLRRALRLRR